MRARYYNAAIKRFINQDTVTGSIESSQSLNRYAYVEGNPVSYLDPFGLERQASDKVHDVIKILEIVIPMMATVDLINNLVFVTSCAVYVLDIQNARSVDETIDAIFGLCNEMVSFTIGELVGKSNVDEILGYIDSGLGSNLSGFVYELSQQISTDIGKMVWKWLQGEK